MAPEEHTYASYTAMLGQHTFSLVQSVQWILGSSTPPPHTYTGREALSALGTPEALPAILRGGSHQLPPLQALTQTPLGLGL